MTSFWEDTYEQETCWIDKYDWKRLSKNTWEMTKCHNSSDHGIQKDVITCYKSKYQTNELAQPFCENVQ